MNQTRPYETDRCRREQLAFQQISERLSRATPPRTIAEWAMDGHAKAVELMQRIVLVLRRGQGSREMLLAEVERFLRDWGPR